MPMASQQLRLHCTDSSPPHGWQSMEPGSPDSSSGGRVRQRLKPWLEAQINSGRFPGLQWVDKAEGIFRITWKHGGRADWCEKDALIFKEWAIHTGRYREGTDSTDWPTWKTRLRCALNKLPDIQELKDRSCYDEPNPYRVYKFVDRRGSGSGSSSPPQLHTPQSVNEDSSGPPTPMYQQQRPSVIQPNIPHIVNDSLDPTASVQRQDEAQVTSLGSDLEQVSINDLLPITDHTISLTNISVDSKFNSGLEPMDTDSMKAAAYHQLSHQVKAEPVDNNQYYQADISHQFTVTLRFRRQVILRQHVTSPYGCRLYYSTQPTIAGMWDDRLYGDSQAEQILVPYDYNQMEQRQSDLTYKLLEALELGVNIFVDKGSLYILRRCKTSVFTAPPNTETKQTIKVQRDHNPVKIFDYPNDFLPALNRYQQGEGPRPSSQVIVAFGQNFRPDMEPYQNLLFSVTVCHPHADFLLDRHMPASPPVEISHSNEYDQFHKYIRSQALHVTQTVPLPQTLPIFHTNPGN